MSVEPNTKGWLNPNNSTRSLYKVELGYAIIEWWNRVVKNLQNDLILPEGRAETENMKNKW